MSPHSKQAQKKIRRRPLELESLEDRRTMSVAAISLRVDGKDTANTGATFSDQSATGRYVVFRSLATNLVAGQQETPPGSFATSDIFRRDRLTGKTELVSAIRGSTTKCGNRPSFDAYISPSGRYVAFESDANNLVAGDLNTVGHDIFVRDMDKHVTYLINVNQAGHNVKGADNYIRESDQTDGRFITDNGFIVFESNASLVSNDTNGQRDVYVRDFVHRKTYLANQNDAGQAGQGPSDHGVLIANGRFVAFESSARNLTPNDVNFNPKIFRRDLAAGGKTVVVSNNDLQNGSLESGGSFLPQISANGQVIAFESFRRLSSADADNANRDVYVRNMAKATPDLVSINSAGGAANSTSFDPNISNDGRFVVFESLASNLTTTDHDPSDPNSLVNLDNKDVFERNLVTGATTLVSFKFDGSRDAFGESRNITVSANGRFVAWESQSLNLVKGFKDGSPGNQFAFDIFRRDMVTKKTTLVNAKLGTTTVSSNEGANFPVISDDGRYITFHSTSVNLVRRDTNSGNGGRQTDVFVSNAAYSAPRTKSATSLAADESNSGARMSIMPIFWLPPVDGNGDGSVTDDNSDPSDDVIQIDDGWTGDWVDDSTDPGDDSTGDGIGDDAGDSSDEISSDDADEIFASADWQAFA